MLKFQRSSDMMRRFIAYGLSPSFARMLTSEIEKWEQCSGPKWTVDRLKSLKQDLIRIHSSQEPLTWVRTNRKGRWNGIWGILRSMAEDNLKQLEISLNCLMVYSSYMAKSLVDEDFDNARKSIESRRVAIPQKIIDDLADHAENILGCTQLGKPESLLLYQGKISTKSPVFDGRSVSQSDLLEKEFDWLAKPSHWDLVEKYQDVFRYALNGLTKRFQYQLALKSRQYRDDVTPLDGKTQFSSAEVHAGSICPLKKDGGLKIRWIANPYRILQVVLGPLGDELFRQLNQLPWDCTYDQTKPYSVVKRHLQQGKKVFCVDLSSATDYFPLSVQLAILKKIFPYDHSMVNLFEDVARGTWTEPRSGQKFRWTNGQPMGLYPSFPSFALAHGVLLDYLSFGRPGLFYVLGDDVIILDPQLYQHYLKTLELLGCPYNPDKTLVSDRVAEFAGKFITATRLVNAYKWRDPNSRNFMELMRTFGQRFKPLLRRREGIVYDRVARLLAPYGCNHSRGSAVPLQDVVLLTDEFESRLPEPRVEARHTSFLHRLADFLKPNRLGSLFHQVCYKWFKKQAVSLDERTDKVFKETPFLTFPGDRGVFMDVVAEPLRAELPTLGPRLRVDQATPLEWYERVLGLSNQA